MPKLATYSRPKLATYYTSFDKGHRHSVTIPLGRLGALELPGPVFTRNKRAARALGQFGARSWQRVYQGSAFIGWAFTNFADAAIVSQACAGAGIRVLKDAPGGWFARILTERNPDYVGAPVWYQLWNRSTQGFLGWYFMGTHTAQIVARQCAPIDVFTSRGFQIR